MSGYFIGTSTGHIVLLLCGVKKKKKKRKKKKKTAPRNRKKICAISVLRVELFSSHACRHEGSIGTTAVDRASTMCIKKGAQLQPSLNY